MSDQKEPFLMRYSFIHCAHKESEEVILQISFKQLTLFASCIDLRPRPPSSLGRHTSFHATLAFLGFRAGPDHKKAEQSRSISFMQAVGSLNAEIQKLVRLWMTELMSCSRPAKERCLAVQDCIYKFDEILGLYI